MAQQRKAAASQKTADNAELLDEEEQEAIVMDFRVQNHRSNLYFKRFMTGLAVVLIAVYCVLIASYYSSLEAEIADLDADEASRRAGWTVPLNNAVSVVGLLSSILYLHRKTFLRSWTVAVVLGAFALGPSVYWLLHWHTMSDALGAFVLFPFVPALIFISVAYAVHDIDESEKDIEQLQQAMYKVKSA